MPYGRVNGIRRRDEMWGRPPLVAQQRALDLCSTVQSLNLVNTFAGLWPSTRQMTCHVVRRTRLVVQRPDMRRAAASIAEVLFPHPARYLLKAQAEARLASNDPDAYRRWVHAVATFRPGRALRDVRCPALIEAGEHDTVVPMGYKARLRRLLPHASLVVIPDSGHATNLDQPALFNRTVPDCVASLERDG